MSKTSITRKRSNVLYYIKKNKKQKDPNEIDRIVNRFDNNYKQYDGYDTYTTNHDSISSSIAASDSINIYASDNCNAITYTTKLQVGNDFYGNNDNDKDDEIFDAVNENNIYESDNDVKSDIMPSISINENVSADHDDNNSNHMMLLNMLPRVYDIDIVTISINKLKSVLESAPPNDSNNIILDQNNLSKVKVSELIHTFSTNSRLTKKCQSQLLGLLNTLIPDVDWPLSINNKNEVVSKVASYVEEDYRILSFDVCPKPNHNCLVFAGKYENDFSCKICSSTRFRKCQKCQLNECRHVNRVPFQRVYYRPLTLLVYDLLKYDQVFLNMINYECKEYNKYEVSDVRNGENFKRHMKEMENNFLNYERENNQPCNMVNLCISQFYDGTMTRKTKVQNFWPLLVTILNFPPDVRNKLGIGTFLMSIYTASSNTPAERFVLEYCFSKELEQFYTGVFLETDRGKFFVQIRLIFTVLDTIGFQDILHVTGANSYDGCFFCMGSMGKGTNLCKGLETDKCAPRMGYIQMRAGLTFRNQLRECGQSKKCCPPGFYQRNYKSDDSKTSNTLSVKDSERFFGFMTYSKQNIDSFSKSFPCLPKKDIDYLFNYLTGNDAENTWDKHHEDYRHNEFQPYLFFNHCCYVPYEKYERKGNADYYGDALEYYRQSGIKREPINGVKGVHHMFRLPYVRFDLDFVYDGFHAIMNLVTNMIQNWKGERAYLNEYHLKTATHFNLNRYSIDDKVHRMFWFLNNNERFWIESIINEILIPVGLSNEFQLTHPFTRSEQLRGIAKIQVLTVCIKMIVTIANFPIPYKKFYVWLSEDINSLLSPVFKSLDDIDKLYLRILEIMVIYQGLFPETESKLINHQIVCIVMHLKISGSLRNTWTIPGERALSTVKEHVPEGGRSFDLQTILNYSASEKLKTDEYFSKMNSENRYNYSDEGFKLHKEQDYSTISLESNEIDSLLYLLINEIKKRSKNIHFADQNFKLFRLYRNYLEYIRKMKRNNKGVDVIIKSLYQYIQDIDIDDIVREFADSIIYYFKRQFILKRYSKAVVYGIEMDSFSNSQNARNGSNLLDDWHEPRSYSSWFKLRSCNYDRNELADDKENSFWHKNDCKKKYLYGQFNYFFELTPLFEPKLGTVLVASAFIRPHDKSDFIDKICINESVINIKYVSLTDVYSTRIMTCSVSHDNYPIKRPDKFHHNVSKTSSSYTRESKDLTHLMMFTLNSDRDNIKEIYELIN